MSMEQSKTTNNSIRFPCGVKVLLIDGDSSSLQEITKTIQDCGYKVTGTSTASEALSILRENRCKFDIVISDIDIHDMDAFKFIEFIALKLDLPLIAIISANNDKNLVIKAFDCGACDYLLKPIQKDNMQLMIWKQVVHKQKHKEIEQSKEGNLVTEIDNESHMSGNSKSGETYKDDECNTKNKNQQKKQRMVWTAPIHDKFVAIVNQLGIKNAVPKKILEMMNVKGLTRENVASHLQKYRIYSRKNDENKQQKVKMQAEAINRINSQMYGNNVRDQANSGQNNLHLSGQKRPSPNISGYIHVQNRISTAIYGLPESRLGLHMASAAKYDILVPQQSVTDQNSNFQISDYYDNRNLERPFKVLKLSHHEPNEAVADDLYSSLNIPFSTIDEYSNRFTSQFIEPDFLLQSGANVYYDGTRVIDNTPISSSEGIYLNQNFEIDGVSEAYDEQFDEHFDSCRTGNNSN